MHIACLQFAPQLGKANENIARADALLNASPPQTLDILMLPELSFTGYNFPSLEAIIPYLEPTAAGPSTQRAKSTAARLQCIVSVGYPELFSPATPSSPLIAYNSTVTVSPTGETLAHYRKTHLYYTDETWAQESPTGWLTASLPLTSKSPLRTVNATLGICMDLNPHKFVAPYSAYEFSNHAISSSSELLVLSMAWLTNMPSPILQAEPAKPDLDTLAYWLGRLKPLMQDAGKNTIVAIANRCGEEEPDARYAGTSWIGRVGGAKAEIWGMLGRGEEGLIVGDTEKPAIWTLGLRERDDNGEEVD